MKKLKLWGREILGIKPQGNKGVEKRAEPKYPDYKFPLSSGTQNYSSFSREAENLETTGVRATMQTVLEITNSYILSICSL